MDLVNDQGETVKSYFLAAAFLWIAPGAVVAFEAGDYIDLGSCSPSSQSFAQCAKDVRASCVDVAADNAQYYRSCEHEFFRQADQLLNDYYKIAVIKAKAVERGFDGTAYSGQEELLRQSQRAWLPVRDTTCDLAVSFGALMSGAAAKVSHCKARLTLQRIADLEKEIGFYLK
ncbi:lysozyme inhibitor LprI family protein [Ruegeria faecimaris]|uniref:lysozyme inhibitor LprI family protein n=1 Tax=Ruegeria faecimaris TaxID=686389 RepID=UPI0024921C29|nr:lysozyme inhibitor LprI family protein [Ruegeria faecimaris]